MLTFIESHVAPEVKEHIDTIINLDEASSEQDIWMFIHPRIRALAKERFDHGFRADAVSAAVREVNILVKNIVKDVTGQELDGAGLMTRAFSPNDPIIKLADISNETGKNLQQGYMHMFQGAMIGIRNPKAHENFDTEYSKAVHLIFVASLLMIKIDERLEWEGTATDGVIPQTD